MIFFRTARYHLFILTILLLAHFIKAQSINDLIQPVRLTGGSPDTLVISDLFYSKDYKKVEFISNKNVEIKFNPQDKTVILTPSDNFEGMDLIDFKYGGSIYELPVISEKLQFHLFEYKPEGFPKKVNLFGSFNGWDRSNIIMHSENGVYKISIPLEPGRYEYKFYVDGEEILDPVNTEKTPNGMGGFNSVLSISPLHSGNCYLHLLRKRESKEGLILSFYYENDSANEQISYSDLIPLINNTRIPKDKIKIDGNKVGFFINNEALSKNPVLRLAVTQKGRVSNIQTVNFADRRETSEKNATLYDQIIYSIMIDRFSNGDKGNDRPVIMSGLYPQANYEGGDFQGIIDKINSGYFDSLGVNTLWLSPVVDNPDSAYREYPAPHRLYTGYHGYWPLNSSKVEEHFGTMNLLKNLISTAHKHNIKIILDYVAHHVFIKNKIFNLHRDWFGVLDLPDGRKNLRLWDEQRLTTWFEPYLPTFNYLDSKDARVAMTDNAVWWLNETNADGFRHDAVKHIPNSFWRLLNNKIETQIELPQHKRIFQIGETFGSYQLVSSYVNNGQLDAQFNFNLYDAAIPTFIRPGSSFTTLSGELQKSFAVYGINNLMGNIMDSHDKVRFMAYADNAISLDSGNASELAWTKPPEVKNKSSYDKLKLYLCYLLTIPGIPVLDYGDEIGMTGAADPDNRRMMRFGDQLSEWEKETISDVSRIIKIRSNNSALRYGDFLTILADTNCFVYMRSDINQNVLVALNKSNKPESLKISLPKAYNFSIAHNLLDSKDNVLDNNSLEINVPALGFRILKLK